LSWNSSTTFDLDKYVHEALRTGASGFLLKDAPELIRALQPQKLVSCGGCRSGKHAAKCWGKLLGRGVRGVETAQLSGL
jgi:hypothetical protein